MSYNVSMIATALAVTVHDPVGRVAVGIERSAARLRRVFDSVAVNATSHTVPSVLDICRASLGAAIVTHEPGDHAVGHARRDALRLALAGGAEQILYSDIDHIIRWIERDEDEVRRALTEPPEEFVVVGRSDQAFAESPARLRETESIVNHIYSLMRPPRAWDLMFAVRRLSHRAASEIVDGCDEKTIANDVAWPLFVESAGYSVGYFAADGLSYRTIQQFDDVPDALDGDASQWIKRLHTASTHAAVMSKYL